MCILSGYILQRKKELPKIAPFLRILRALCGASSVLSHHQKRYMAHKLFKPKRLHLRTLR